MKKNMIYSLILTMLFGGSACEKQKVPEPVVALKSVTITPLDNAVSYRCTGNYSWDELTNEGEKIQSDVSVEELRQSTITVETTLGIDIQAYYEGIPIGPEGVKADASKPFRLEVRGYGQTRFYTVIPQQEAGGATDTGEVLLKSSDMRKMGLPLNTLDYSISLLNGKFYCFTTGKEGETAEYRLFVSDNGIKWNEVDYRPTELGAIGGTGSKALVFRDRLYVLGGARIAGTDKWGVAPEQSWGMPAISWWRSFSTDDGQTFRCDTVNLAAPWEPGWGETLSNPNLPEPSAFPNVIAHTDGKMYLKNAYYIGFGQLQGSGEYRVTEDGANWTKLSAIPNITNRRQDAFFSFKQKMWCAGGFKNFISSNQNNAFSSVYSSENGIDWVEETENGGFGKMWAMTVVTDNRVAYMIGGECYDEEGKRKLSDKIYRSEDGIRWEPIHTGSQYTARRCPQVVVKDGYIYIFGGYGAISEKFYGYDLQTIPMFDTYKIRIK